MRDVSALMDGELEPKKVNSTIVRLEDQDELWDAWATFHVIRDTLQGNAIGPSSRFHERFHERLQAEPVPVVPVWRGRLPDARTRRWIAAGGVLLVAALLWALYGAGLPGRTSPAVAPGAAEALLAGRGDDQVAVEYTMAHRQLVPAYVAVAPAR